MPSLQTLLKQLVEDTIKLKNLYSQLSDIYISNKAFSNQSATLIESEISDIEYIKREILKYTVQITNKLVLLLKKLKTTEKYSDTIYRETNKYMLKLIKNLYDINTEYHTLEKKLSKNIREQHNTLFANLKLLNDKILEFNSIHPDQKIYDIDTAKKKIFKEQTLKAKMFLEDLQKFS